MLPRMQYHNMTSQLHDKASYGRNNLTGLTTLLTFVSEGIIRH